MAPKAIMALPKAKAKAAIMALPKAKAKAKAAAKAHAKAKGRPISAADRHPVHLIDHAGPAHAADPGPDAVPVLAADPGPGAWGHVRSGLALQREISGPDIPPPSFNPNETPFARYWRRFVKRTQHALDILYGEDVNAEIMNRQQMEHRLSNAVDAFRRAHLDWENIEHLIMTGQTHMRYDNTIALRQALQPQFPGEGFQPAARFTEPRRRAGPGHGHVNAAGPVAGPSAVLGPASP